MTPSEPSEGKVRKYTPTTHFEGCFFLRISHTSHSYSSLKSRLLHQLGPRSPLRCMGEARTRDSLDPTSRCSSNGTLSGQFSQQKLPHVLAHLDQPLILAVQVTALKPHMYPFGVILHIDQAPGRLHIHQVSCIQASEDHSYLR